MDKLQWFKFSYADWRMGKIQRCSEITQARFINLCCLYWSKEANLSLEDAEIEIDKEHLDALIAKKVIEYDGEHIFIKFLDEQLVGITETSKGKSKAAKARWDKYRENKKSTGAMHVHTDAMQNNAEERRVEKSREEEIKREIVNSHTWIESICKKKKLSNEMVNLYLGTFLDDLELKDDFSKGLKEIKAHFVGWLNLEMDKQPKKKDVKPTSNLSF